MPAAKHILVIPQGTDFEQSFQWLNDANQPVELTGVYTAESELREKYADEEAALTFDIELEPDELGTGWIRISSDHDATEALSFTKGVWDLKVTKIATGKRDRLLEGIVEIGLQVTR
jgi:hypothetical protein